MSVALRSRRPTLTGQILLLQLAIVVVTVSAGALVSWHQTRRQLDEQYGQRCLAIAEATAALPAVRDAFDDPDPPATIQPLAEAIRKASDATFVVVANDRQIRYSHPNPANIGKPLSTDPGPAMRGRPYVTTETGTLGRSVRAKAPIFDDRGKVIGIVSVGILQDQVSAQLRAQLPALAAYVLLALLLGTVGSWLLARRVKRQTFGLEPDEIGALLEQREAVLHGIREGVIAVDPAGRIMVANGEASRLLGLHGPVEGRLVAELLPPSRLRDTLGGTSASADEVLLAADRVLVANRMPVRVRERDIGAVITLRDRTELEGLVHELDTVRGLANALRAQAHESSNRMHTVAGLIELEHYDDALRFIARQTSLAQTLSESLIERIGEPALVALLLAKSAEASEHGVELRLSEATELAAPTGNPSGRQPPDVDPTDLVTIVGNLVDNAIDAASGLPGEPADGAAAWVEVTVRSTPDGTLIEVHDSGPGIETGLGDELFRDGYSTKSARSVSGRGLGLALVQQVVRRRGGTIAVRNDGGAVFTVRLPAVLGDRASTAPAVTP
jgi:two-component system CitB family sensor kinase